MLVLPALLSSLLIWTLPATAVMSGAEWQAKVRRGPGQGGGHGRHEGCRCRIGIGVSAMCHDVLPGRCPGPYGRYTPRTDRREHRGVSSPMTEVAHRDPRGERPGRERG